MPLSERSKHFVRTTLPGPLLRQVRLFRARSKAEKITARNRSRARLRHRLPQSLLVSLTSFKPRFGTLHLTLQSLLDQTVRPDAVVLWIAENEVAQLPARVRALEAHGLLIRECADLRSYKKLIFALAEFPEAYIATADDDVFYEPQWLETMVKAAETNERVVICHRANRVVEGTDGLAPYRDWPLDVQDDAARKPSIDLLPTGIGGILYPPDCFSGEVTKRELFEELCPTADDLWFYWMARKAGTRHMKIGGKFEQILWPTALHGSLAQENWAGGNDRQVRNLQDRFGNPLHF